MGGGLRRGAGQLAPDEHRNRRHAALAAPVCPAADRRGRFADWRRAGRPRRSLPLPAGARRLRHRGLENPLLPLPAVLAVAVGFFLPLAVLVVYSFWPTEDGRIVHQLDDRELHPVLHRGSLLADAASLVRARRIGIRAHGSPELSLRLFRGSQGAAVAAAGLDPDRDHSILDQLSDPGPCLAHTCSGTRD